jgi:hypothetical protein
VCGSMLWRAQLGYDHYAAVDFTGEQQPAPFPVERMKPLRNRAREGRANPKGIPYLYLATHQDTAMAEVRPWVGSLISIGRFALKRDVHVLNCVSNDHRMMVYSRVTTESRTEREFRLITSPPGGSAGVRRIQEAAVQQSRLLTLSTENRRAARSAALVRAGGTER